VTVQNLFQRDAEQKGDSRNTLAVLITGKSAALAGCGGEIQWEKRAGLSEIH
jgi:hypothetical protein